MVPVVRRNSEGLGDATCGIKGPFEIVVSVLAGGLDPVGVVFVGEVEPGLGVAEEVAEEALLLLEGASRPVSEMAVGDDGCEPADGDRGREEVGDGGDRWVGFDIGLPPRAVGIFPREPCLIVCPRTLPVLLDLL